MTEKRGAEKNLIEKKRSGVALCIARYDYMYFLSIWRAAAFENRIFVGAPHFILRNQTVFRLHFIMKKYATRTEPQKSYFFMNI